MKSLRNQLESVCTVQVPCGL